MLFKFSSVSYFSKYHDCKRRTEVLVLFFVFSEAMSSLKVFIFSSVYVTIDPGTSPVVASPSCLVELLLAIFWAMLTGVPCFLVVTSERGFFMPLQEFVVQFETRKMLRLTLKNRRFCLFLAVQKVTMVLKTI